MPLPVDPRQLIAQPQMFPPEYPPFLPNVPVHETVSVYTKAIAAAMATAISKKVVNNQNNCLWIFTFNLTAINNFRNEYFSHAFKIAADNVAYRLMTGRGGMSNQDFEKAIEESVLMTASSLANMFYNDLAPYLYQEQVVSIQQNLQHLQVVTEAVAGLIFNRTGMPQANHAPAAHQAFGGIGQPQSQNNGLSTYGMGKTGYYDPSVEKKQEEDRLHNEALLSRRSSLVTGIRGNANESGSNKVHKEERSKEPNAFNKQGKKYQYITGGIEEVDPKVHAIAYGSQTFSAPGGELQESFLAQAKHAADLAKLALEDKLNIPDKMISESVVVVSGMEDLLTNIRSRYIKEAKGVDIFTASGMVGVPIMAPFDLSDLQERIKAKNNLFDIRKEIIEWAEEKSKVEDPRVVQMVTAQLDRVMTNQINDVLKYELDLETRMTSALTDMDELEAYLKDKTEFYLHSQYRKACRDIGSNVAKGLTDLDSIYGDSVNFDEDSGVFFFPYFKSVFVTYLTATHEELGYNVNRTIKRISKEHSPILQKLTDSVITLGEKRNYRCSENYILTADGYLYRIAADTAVLDMINIIRVD